MPDIRQRISFTCQDTGIKIYPGAFVSNQVVCPGVFQEMHLNLSIKPILCITIISIFGIVYSILKQKGYIFTRIFFLQNNVGRHLCS